MPIARRRLTAAQSTYVKSDSTVGIIYLVPVQPEAAKRYRLWNTIEILIARNYVRYPSCEGNQNFMPCNEYWAAE